jgi:hypothetical protein
MMTLLGNHQVFRQFGVRRCVRSVTTETGFPFHARPFEAGTNGQPSRVASAGKVRIGSCSWCTRNMALVQSIKSTVSHHGYPQRRLHHFLET